MTCGQRIHKLWTLFRILFKCVYDHCKYIKRFVKTLIQTEKRTMHALVKLVVTLLCEKRRESVFIHP